MEQVQESPVAEESIDAYIARENALERGLDAPVDDVPVLDQAPEPKAEEPSAEGEPKAEPEPKAAAPERDEQGKFKGKPRNDPRARVEQATAKEAQAKRERDEAIARIQALETELQTLKTPKPAAQPVAPAAQPVAGFPDYQTWASQADNAQKTYEDYLEARVEHRFEQRERAKQQQEAQARYAQADAQRMSDFTTRLQTAVADDEQFWNRVDPKLTDTPRLSVLVQTPHGWIDRTTGRQTPPPTFTNWIVDQVIECEHPHVVLEALSDPQTFQRLATLPPAKVLRELAKLDVKPAPAAAVPRGPARKPVTSTAPDPYTPLGSSPVASADEPGDDEPIEKYIARTNAQDRKAGRF